ncbi:conserved hypothetical protein [Theileria equi strain WA]|uniref:Uncharacterized protein n=1 Tax=Theileria equi strain WA TaxID=1537102 RepID=L1LDG5_THEEQ|nr:conserved hypothetical protein [Theileria equi strain WA]EKX73213.1 conserved hypothetical protein [Theileria equi strain WA]|eukprot:XP_004832665.1 conserved hypothetical protein [Theileria equi strain WA]
MARLRVLDLTRLVNVAKYSKKAWNDVVTSARRDIFGYKSGYPGEDEWIKPLQGPSRNRWYWPSKYLHMDFTIRYYLGMQLQRLKEKEENPTIHDLWDTICQFRTHRIYIESFLRSVDEETFSKSITIQDTHALYYLIFQRSPLRFTPNSAFFTCPLKNPKYDPFIKYALRVFMDQSLDEKKVEKVDLPLSQKLRQLLQSKPSLLKCFNTRNRFVNTFYLRRRAYHLEKLSKKRKISETRRKYRAHFLTHPDKKEIWPDNKGITQYRWPSR